MVWYYAEGDRQRGPVSDEEFQEMVDRGRVREETLVWKDGMENWVPLKSAVETGLVSISPVLAQTLNLPPPPSPGGTGNYPLQAGQPATGAANCAQCGRGPLTEADSVRLGNLALCKACDGDMARHYHYQANNVASEDGVYQSAAELPYASIFQRFCAIVVDNLFLTVMVMIVVAITMDFNALSAMMPSPGSSPEEVRAALQELMAGPLRAPLIASILLNFLYNSVLVSAFGATLGKMTMGIRVAQADGSKVSPTQAIVRALLPNVLQLPALFTPMSTLASITGYVVLIALAIALFDQQKRTLYDHIAGTRVIRN